MRGRIVRQRRRPRAKGTRSPVAIPLLAPRAGEHRLQRALARQRPRGCRLFERLHRLGPLTRRGGHLPEPPGGLTGRRDAGPRVAQRDTGVGHPSCLGKHPRSEEHTSELQSLYTISYAVFCLKKKKNTPPTTALKQNHSKKKNKKT